MKTQFTILLSLLLGTATFAQTAADEAAIRTLLNQSTKDAYALKQADYDAGFTNAASVFRAYNTRSGYATAVGPTKLTDIFGSKPREVNPLTENFSFKFYGSNAARVVYDQYLYGKENNKPSREIRVLEKVNGQWKIDALVALWDYGQNKYEEDLVRKAIDTETRAFHEANQELLMAQWATEKPYIERQQANLIPTGAPFLKGDNLRAFSESYFKTLQPSGNTVRFSDYDVHVSGETAWATYTQEELDKAGTVLGKQREIRILERVPSAKGPAWKIVFLGFQEMK
ncbi:hypothetical protein [Spirosoma montaniterrae]|uniref:DUF4440 domain-containing protein n=1 Tax=Spirosoma montaniterrae TaxID=1178516 RepID=A0A1P9WT32_9BACT|nr:hypothetical protein [Spirosoma montaniterrae]AQG78527.1 hypothetical protein AWR27_03725 [Spirosoma montaniterrae]